MKTLELLLDDKLVQLYIAGNNFAFDTLVNRHKDKVFRHIFNMVRDEDVANDVFQDTFIKVIVNIQQGRYADEGKLAAWIMRIAHNLTIDYFRKQAAENTMSMDDVHASTEIKMFETEKSIQDVILYEDTLKEVGKLMNQLPESQREIVLMRFYQDMSFKEIAESLDISINTALGRMRYSLINMKKMATKLDSFN